MWLGADGQVRGIVSLDAVAPKEFEHAFRRWEPTLRRIGPEEVADAVYEAVRPGVVAEVDGRGYQSGRFTVKPKTVRCVVRPPLRLGEVAVVEPMPLLL